MKKTKKFIAWTIALEGRPCPFYMRHRKRDAIEAFNNNITDKTKTIKDYWLYKPVKVSMEVIS